MKILGANLELPATQHCQSSPFTSKLAGSSQTAPRILIYSFYMKTIETHARAFFKVIMGGSVGGGGGGRKLQSLEVRVQAYCT